MFRLRRLIGGSVVVFILAGAALAQENSAPAASRDAVAAPLVTATATAKRVRFVSPGTVVQLRLEVYNEPGQKVFDTELRGGNVLDWHLQDGAGERLPAGTYATVLTIKGLSGRLSQRVGSVTVDDQRAAIEPTGAVKFSLAQQQTIGPVEGNEAFAVLQESEAEAMTAVTHDGQDGQVTSTRGALTFRTGDLFAGKDKEQMRLTQEGNLGIGTDKPQAKLDVAGTIRTSEGIEFGNGDGTKATRLTTTATGGLQQTLADGNVVASATGTGTQNNIAKWTDNAGTLGDSSIFENASRNVGIGTTTPGAKLHVVGTPGVFGAGTFQMDGGVLFNNWASTYPAFEVLNKNLTDNNVALFQFSDAPSGAAHAGIGAVNTSHVNKFGDLFFFTKQSDGYQMRMGIFGGNVGIGTTAPAHKLDVVGNINTSTQYNIGGIRALTIYGSSLGGDPSLINSNTFVGADSGLNTPNNQSGGRANSFFGKAAGFNNTTGFSNSFFGSFSGYSNGLGYHNSFFGVDAGRGNTFGHSNSFFGSQAGLANDYGQNNSFFGFRAGEFNVSGSGNVFSGGSAGRSNTEGGGNTFIGTSSGEANTQGHGNTFIGVSSGSSNTVENFNLLIGYLANGAAGITNATAIGVRAQVTQSNSLVLGSISGTNGAEADTNVGIGTTAPTYKLHIIDASNVGIRVETSLAGGRVASFAANGDFQVDAPNISGGRFAVMEGGNVGINTPTPNAKLHVVGGDVAITTQLKGLILRANNGANCFRLLVNNTGALGTESVACP